VSAHNSDGAWELPHEFRQMQTTARRFMRERIVPAEAPLPHDAYALPDDVLKPLQEEARRLGFWNVESPAEWGGAGLNLLGQAIVAEESSQCKMGLYIAACHAFGWDPPNAIFLGRKDQIEKYAVPALNAGSKTFVAISEASGGSDPGRAIKTRAEKKGDRYILNGTKIWISGVGQSDWGLVFARTGPSKGRDGVTSFIVEKKFKGFSYKPIPVIRSYFPYEINFEDCEVPEENVLGPVGQGYKIAIETLNEGRIGIGAQMIGVAQGALSATIAYLSERKQFGKSLSEFQGIQFQVAQAATELEAARLMVYNASRLKDAGRDIAREGAMAKLLSSQVCERVTSLCVELFGGYGYTKDYPVEKYYRDAKIGAIYEGTSNMQLQTIAKAILRDS